MTPPAATPPGDPTYKAPSDRERDAALVARVTAGERETFGMLVRHHERSVYNFMLRHRLDATTAADLTQEAFLKAFRSLASYRPEKAAFKTWLYTIAFNLIRDNARRLDVRSRRNDELQRAAEVEPPPRGHDDLLATKDQVERLLALVDDEARSLLVLRYLQEVPYGEISEVTGMPPATIRSKVHRALKKIQAQLKADADAGGGAG